MVTGKVNEAIASAYVDNSLATVSDNGFIATDIHLVEGLNTITVVALDEAGNQGRTTASVNLDTLAPDTSISGSPAGILNVDNVHFSFTSTEAIASFECKLDDEAFSVCTSSIRYSNLTDGVHTFLVKATDGAGNVDPIPAVFTWTVDTISPVIQVSVPQINAILNTPLITVSGNIVDANLAGLWIDNNPVQLTGQSFSQATVALTEGQSTINLRASDLAGNESTVYIPVTLDTVPPTVSITAPVSGALVKTQTIMVSGRVSDPSSAPPYQGGDWGGTVTVNNIAAQVTGQDYTLSGVALVEGVNTISVRATDRAGNSGLANISTFLDSIAPTAPIVSQPLSPTLIPLISINGTVEAGSLVTLSLQTGQNAASVVGTATATNQGTFSISNITLSEGENIFTATATDSAGNKSGSSVPVIAVLDTKPPKITITAPANNSFTNQSSVVVTGSVDEAVELKINGSVVAVDGLAFTQTVNLTSATNFIVISAKDLAGNTATLNWVVYLDQTSPSVSITSPIEGFLTRTSAVTITGTVSETNAIVTINGTAATVSNKNFTLTNYSLAEGQNALAVSATDRAGNIGNASINIFLDTQAPVVSVTAPAQAAAGANIIISTAATDDRGLSLSDVKVNNVSIWSFSPNYELSTQNSFAYTISADVSPGSSLTIKANATDTAGNIGIATTQIQITAGPSGPGYIQGEVYDDTKGMLLPGTDTIITDISTATEAEFTRMIAGSDGGYFVEAPAGQYLVTLARPEFTAVDRKVTVNPEKNTLAVDARLTPISTRQNLIDSNGGTIKTQFGVQSSGFVVTTSEQGTLNIELSIPPNALTEQTDIRVTPVSNQGLAGLLPIGWSPIAVVDIRTLTLNSEPGNLNFNLAVTLKVPIVSSMSLTASSPITLASYDGTTHQWLTQTPGAVSADGTFITANIASPGQYVFVLSDSGSVSSSLYSSPLMPEGGINTLVSNVTATGRVVPAVAPAAVGLKAVGQVFITPSPLAGEGGGEGGLVSGLIINAKVVERFDLLSGEVVLPSDYTQDLVLYRYPCMTNFTLNSELRTQNTGKVGTTFSITPTHEYTIVDLMTGKIHLEIYSRESNTTTGALVGVEGARLLDKDGNVISIPQGALISTIPVETKLMPASTITGIVGSDFILLRAVDVNFTGRTLSTSAELSIPAPTGISTSLPIVVARAIEIKGVKKLKLVALAKLSGSLVTTLATGPLTLFSPGITTSGQYFFLQAKAALGFASGIVKDGAAKTYPSAQVTTNTCSLVDLTDSDGKYLVASTVANFTLTASDIYKNDKGQRVGTITAGNQSVSLDVTINVTPPSVASVSPADGELGVAPKSQIVITMSEAVKPESVTSINVFLEDSTGTKVQGVFALSPDGTVITFYPSQNLNSEAVYSLTVTHSIQDLQGYFMGQDFVSHFMIKDTTPPPMPVAGSIVSSFPDADGYVTSAAGQGRVIKRVRIPPRKAGQPPGSESLETAWQQAVLSVG